MIAIIKDHYEYVLVDYFGTIYGYFETEGLAHQYLLEQFPNLGRKDERPYGSNVLDREYRIVRIKKEGIA